MGTSCDHLGKRSLELEVNMVPQMVFQGSPLPWEFQGLSPSSLDRSTRLAQRGWQKAVYRQLTKLTPNHEINRNPRGTSRHGIVISLYSVDWTVFFSCFISHPGPFQKLYNPCLGRCYVPQESAEAAVPSRCRPVLVAQKAVGGPCKVMAGLADAEAWFGLRPAL